MRKHRLDPFSLISGGMFTVIAVVYLIASLDDRAVNGRIVLPLTLIGLGVAGLVGALTAVVRGTRRPPAGPEQGERPQD